MMQVHDSRTRSVGLYCKNDHCSIRVKVFSVFCVVRSDGKACGPDECRRAQMVQQGSIKFYPHWRVSRPGLLGGSGGSDSSAADDLLSLKMCRRAHCRMTNMELREHVMSESVVSCPQSHNDHLVFSRKEVVCIPSVVVRMLLKPSSPLHLFHYGLCFLNRVQCLILTNNVPRKRDCLSTLALAFTEMLDKHHIWGRSHLACYHFARTPLSVWG